MVTGRHRKTHLTHWDSPMVLASHGGSGLGPFEAGARCDDGRRSLALETWKKHVSNTYHIYMYKKYEYVCVYIYIYIYVCVFSGTPKI